MAADAPPGRPPPAAADVAIAEHLDVTGQRCPLPVLKARKRIKALAPGSVLRLTADDPVAVIDVAHFCRTEGHELIARIDAGPGWHFLIRKGGPPPGPRTR